MTKDDKIQTVNEKTGEKKTVFLFISRILNQRLQATGG